MSDRDRADFWTLSESLAWGQRQDPPASFQDFLRTLHELCSAGRVHAIGHRPTGLSRDALVPIPPGWMELYFDSDGEKLRSEDLFSGLLHGRRTWISVQFSQADLVREWPKAGAAAFVTELASSYWDQRDAGRRYDRERSRREWIDRFAAKQRQIRRWISFVDIADACARAAAPASISEEREAHSLAYRRLVESISRGEFEKNGKSQVLMLVPHLHVPIPSHRLTGEYFQGY